MDVPCSTRYRVFKLKLPDTASRQDYFPLGEYGHYMLLGEKAIKPTVYLTWSLFDLSFDFF